LNIGYQKGNFAFEALTLFIKRQTPAGGYGLENLHRQPEAQKAQISVPHTGYFFNAPPVFL
jgi:hypothetical protein